MTACVMNFITYERAYCLYPRATLETRLSLVCTDRNDEVIARVFDRYTARGWTILYALGPTIPTSAQNDPAFSSRSRWVDDGQSWSIPLSAIPEQDPQLPTAHLGEPALSRDPSSVTNWRLDQRDPITQEAVQIFYSLDSPLLFYHYLTVHTIPFQHPELQHLFDIAEDQAPISENTTDSGAQQ